MGQLMSGKFSVFNTSVSETDAEQFLKEIGIMPCQVCGHDQWDITIGPPGADEYLSIWTTKDQSMLGSNHLPVYTTACVRCGFLRTFLLHPLTEWVAERRKHNG